MFGISSPTLAYALFATFFLLAPLTAKSDGTVTHLSGAASLRKADGRITPVLVGTKILEGEVISTGVGAYIRVEMSDGSEFVLRPDTTLKLEGYKFTQGKPTEDSLIYSVAKGGLRTISGFIGKRGNKDAYELKTPTATIGIRGTQFDLRVCDANCGALASGTYLSVRYGAVQASNSMGSQSFAAGQIAYVPAQQPPTILPRDPGVGFTPPAVIPKLDEKKKVAETAKAAETAPPPAQGSSQQNKPGSPASPPSNTTATSQPSAGSAQEQSSTPDAPGCVIQ